MLLYAKLFCSISVFRLDGATLHVQYDGMMLPVHICWGGGECESRMIFCPCDMPVIYHSVTIL